MPNATMGNDDHDAVTVGVRDRTGPPTPPAAAVGRRAVRGDRNALHADHDPVRASDERRHAPLRRATDAAPIDSTMNTPVEVVETAYPLRIDRYESREDSGGPGNFRDGLGLRRDITVRAHDARFSLLADRRRHRPYGVAGGDPGAPGDAVLYDADGADEHRPGKATRELPPGSTVSV
ncbi:MAG: hydantoinase B/oxoprolinase family protein, partial [Haloferacaceae archaeon]